MVLLEFPEIKVSWFKRLWFEYFHCLAISKELKPDIWISMHDITPRVRAEKKFVYCHNPSPFYKSTFFDLRFDPKFYLFSKFYVFLYQLNIRNNRAVIVQQSWLAEFFRKKFSVNVVVASPITQTPNEFVLDTSNQFTMPIRSSKAMFFYPSLARTFKNFEVLFNAFEYLKEFNSEVYNKVQIVVTISDEGNPYEKKLVKRFSHLENVSFVGFLSREMVDHYYKRCNAVIFPSKLETWGLPISEAKSFGKPIVLANMAYAKETIGSYDKVKFFDVNDHIGLAKIFENIVNNEVVFGDYRYQKLDEFPKFQTWEELCNYILE